MATQPVRFKRAKHLVCYWESNRFVIHDFAAATRAAASPVMGRLMHACAEWRSLSSIQSELRDWTADAVRAAVTELVDHGFLVRSDRPAAPYERAMREWDGWNPAAGFFHFSTKDARYPRSPADAARRWREAGPQRRMPPVVKSYSRANQVSLPRSRRQEPFPQVLRDRRTWREFAARPVSFEDLSTLLQLTWGVQQWGELEGHGRVALKTSPSGGARHPGEVYVLALRIQGLARGLYHYDASRHRLARLRAGATARDVARYLPGQRWYRGASALLLMTAVFRREQWRYDFPRAYRAVLLDAGHLCQTCCLTATWLGLAPFCSMAFADSVIERDLGIDGIAESMVYVAGIGARPARGWVPWSGDEDGGANVR